MNTKYIKKGWCAYCGESNPKNLSAGKGRMFDRKSADYKYNPGVMYVMMCKPEDIYREVDIFKCTSGCTIR